MQIMEALEHDLEETSFLLPERRTPVYLAIIRDLAPMAPVTAFEYIAQAILKDHGVSTEEHRVLMAIVEKVAKVPSLRPRIQACDAVLHILEDIAGDDESSFAHARYLLCVAMSNAFAACEETASAVNVMLKVPLESPALALPDEVMIPWAMKLGKALIQLNRAEEGYRYVGIARDHLEETAAPFPDAPAQFYISNSMLIEYEEHGWARAFDGYQAAKRVAVCLLENEKQQLWLASALCVLLMPVTQERFLRLAELLAQPYDASDFRSLLVSLENRDLVSPWRVQSYARRLELHQRFLLPMHDSVQGTREAVFDRRIREHNIFCAVRFQSVLLISLLAQLLDAAYNHTVNIIDEMIEDDRLCATRQGSQLIYTDEQLAWADSRLGSRKDPIQGEQILFVALCDPYIPFDFNSIGTYADVYHLRNLIGYDLRKRSGDHLGAQAREAAISDLNMRYNESFTVALVQGGPHMPSWEQRDVPAALDEYILKMEAEGVPPWPITPLRLLFYDVCVQRFLQRPAARQKAIQRLAKVATATYTIFANAEIATEHCQTAADWIAPLLVEGFEWDGEAAANLPPLTAPPPRFRALG